jgi:hypothetical protein
MPRPPLRLPEGEVVRLALTRREAAEALGISLNSFERHVQPEVKVVRRGKLRLIPISALERWLEENAASIVEDLSDRAGSPRLECGQSGRAPCALTHSRGLNRVTGRGSCPSGLLGSADARESRRAYGRGMAGFACAVLARGDDGWSGRGDCVNATRPLRLGR